MQTYLWLCLANNARRVVLLESPQRLRELGLGCEGRDDRYDHVGGQVGNSGHYTVQKSVYVTLDPPTALVQRRAGVEAMAGRMVAGTYRPLLQSRWTPY